MPVFEPVTRMTLADIEIAKYKTATPEIEGVEIVRTSILEETLDPVGLAGKCVYVLSSC